MRRVYAIGTKEISIGMKGVSSETRGKNIWTRTITIGMKTISIATQG